MKLPSFGELTESAVVVGVPLRVRFRGVMTREALLLRGPAGWGEFAPFPEYPDDEAANWLAAGIEAAWMGPPAPLRGTVPINATVPAIDAARVPEVLARFDGARTAKVKVAEAGQTPKDDMDRVAAVRELIPNVRVDANGGWSVDEAVEMLSALTSDGPLEYAEQPCATVEELVAVRRRLPNVRVAADESIRRADDPMKVVRAGGADVAVVKVAPLGGMRALSTLSAELAVHGVPVVVSSALDTAVGISSGLAAAAALPELEFACGLGTGGLFTSDVAESRVPVDGELAVTAAVPDERRLIELAVSASRANWWFERMRRAHELLGAGSSSLFV